MKVIFKAVATIAIALFCVTHAQAQKNGQYRVKCSNNIHSEDIANYNEAWAKAFGWTFQDHIKGCRVFQGQGKFHRPKNMNKLEKQLRKAEEREAKKASLSIYN